MACRSTTVTTTIPYSYRKKVPRGIQDCFYGKIISSLQYVVLSLKARLKSIENKILEEIRFICEKLDHTAKWVKCSKATFLS